MSRKEIILAILLWVGIPASMMLTSHHQQPAEKPFQLSPAAAMRVADLRGRAQVIEDRLTIDQDDATFKRAEDEADKLKAEADSIESTELDKWLDAPAAVGSQGAK